MSGLHRSALALGLVLALSGCYAARMSVEDANGRDESVWAFGIGVADMRASLPSQAEASQGMPADEAQGDAPAGSIEQTSLGVSELWVKGWEATTGMVVTLAKFALSLVGQELL